MRSCRHTIVLEEGFGEMLECSADDEVLFFRLPFSPEIPFHLQTCLLYSESIWTVVMGEATLTQQEQVIA
jgi:hypothetical protein